MQMKRSALDILRPVALGLGIFGASSAMVGAQSQDQCGSGKQTSQTSWNSFDPAYNSVTSWQSAWDSGDYDRNHMLLGTVGSFSAYRLTLANSGGDTMMVDLKNGTVIKPTGTTPMAGEKVAVFGYWSNGTFIANRVIVHS
jgi:hypothetical protein